MFLQQQQTRTLSTSSAFYHTTATVNHISDKLWNVLTALTLAIAPAVLAEGQSRDPKTGPMDLGIGKPGTGMDGQGKGRVQ